MDPEKLKRADELIRKLSIYQDFDALIRVDQGYWPSLLNYGYNAKANQELADLYDERQSELGDPRRASR